jgi:hypothetical protein
MDMEKNLTGTVDSEKNESITSGRNKAKKIRRSNNHPIKVTLFRSRNESKMVTGAEYYAWTNRRPQETGKPAVVMV